MSDEHCREKEWSTKYVFFGLNSIKYDRTVEKNGM